MPIATNEWYFFPVQLGTMVMMILLYKPSISLHIQIYIWLVLPDTNSCMSCSTVIRILAWLVVKNAFFFINCTQLQGFPIDSHKFVWVRRMIKSWLHRVSWVRRMIKSCKLSCTLLIYCCGGSLSGEREEGGVSWVAMRPWSCARALSRNRSKLARERWRLASWAWGKHARNGFDTEPSIFQLWIF